MRRMFYKKIAAAGVFVVLLSLGAVLNIRNSAKEIKALVEADMKDKLSLSTAISKVDTMIIERAYGRYAFIDAYGYMQRLLDKKEENDFEVIKDDNGSLHLAYFETKPKETMDLASEMAEFQERLKDKDTKVLYMMAPDKFIVGETVMEPGFPYNYANETADNFLKDITALGVDSFDFREELKASGIDVQEQFYRTDHHWTTQTAFFAYTRLVNELSTKYGLKVDDLSYYTDSDHYNFVTYKDSFLGSLGRKSGSLYSGVDDYTLIFPKFKTEYSFSAESYDNKIATEGRFEEALLNLGMLGSGEDKFDPNSDRYATYLYGNQGITHITNKTMQDGPKILLVKDSYMMPVAAFLSTICSDVYLVDPRYYEGDISEYAASIEGLDYALVSFYPQNLTKEFFRLNRAK